MKKKSRSVLRNQHGDRVFYISTELGKEGFEQKYRGEINDANAKEDLFLYGKRDDVIKGIENVRGAGDWRETVEDDDLEFELGDESN